MSVTINGSTGIAGVDGTASTPAVQGGDSNTGVFFPAADTIAFANGGAEAARIDSSGRVLVGTSSASLSDSVVQLTKTGAANGSTTNLLVLNNDNTSNNDNLSTGIAWMRTGNDSSYIYTQISSIRTGTHDTDLAFSTNSGGTLAERMRINNAGRTFFYGNTDVFVAVSGAGAGTSDTIMIGGYSATSTTTGSASYYVRTNGNVQNINNSYGAISDVKLKENIVDASSQWDDLKALQVRNYNFKEGQTHTQIGLVAQEAELVSPGLVSESPDRDEEGNDLGTVTKSVNYSVLYMKAVKALQEAMERIETLESEMTAVKAALDAATNQQEVTS